MDNIFISYSHKDGQWVWEWLVPRLEGAGIQVHIDSRDFEIGRPALINMETAVKECKWTILVLSPHWIESQWTQFEGLMLQHRDPLNLQGCIIPLMLEKCKLPDRLSIFTFADFTEKNKWENELVRLLRQMGITCIPGSVSGIKVVKPIEEAVSLYKLPVTGDCLFGREKELKLLDDAWADCQTDILSLVAWGGVGKTALVNQWLNQLKTDNYRGAQKVYGWSFYSQGAQEGKQASADEFFQETLQWFGDAHPEAGSAVDKGRRLARLARQQKTLLILDGLEPLQYPPGEIHGFNGKLKDAGLAAFLKELACGNTGSGAQKVLCVITTREPVTDLLNRKGYGVKEIQLEHLSEEAGKELLKSLGVTIGSPKDFHDAVTEYGGHALALTLLGQYIANILDGDIRRRDEIIKSSKGKIKEGHHAQKVMEAYERCYIRYPKLILLRRFKCFCHHGPELNILYIMGLFDRPVEVGTIEALKKKPVIPGVTDKLQRISVADWQMALSNLRKAHLLAKESLQKKGTLDCHPLVREYFGEKLRQENPAGWKKAHERLYHYFKDLPEKEFPDTLAEMEPLFAAVAHGCMAGQHQEALDELYWKRIIRGDEHYCTKKLGAFGSDLACLSHFFAVLWGQPAAGLNEAAKAAVLNWAAFDLRALGRLREAVQLMKASLEMHINQENWRESALDASNLSELLLTLGDVKEAVAAARQSVTYADQSGDWEEQMIRCATLADALHQAGELKEAEQWFLDAEAMQKKRQPQYPYLYSLQGYRFCDLLLENHACARIPGQIKEVMERAEKALEISKRNGWLLAIALDNLTQGRAWMLWALGALAETPKEPPPGDHLLPMARAMNYLDQAVEGLRKAGQQQYLTPGLIIRAEGYRHMKEYAKAQDDLSEARDIAELGEMKLHLCDYHLEAGRLCHAQGKMEEAAEHFQAAKKLIDETGYERRRKELRDNC